MALIAGLIVVFGAVASPAPPAGAAGLGCNYGTGGFEASSLCWIDFSAYSEAAARSASGQVITAALPGGYTASFTVKTTDVAGHASGAVSAVATPTWGGAAMGTSAYTGIAGEAALYNTTNTPGQGTQIQLSNIVITDSAGVSIGSYSLLVGDAETTGTNEQLIFNSNSAMTRLNAAVPICGGGLTTILRS